MKARPKSATPKTKPRSKQPALKPGRPLADVKVERRQLLLDTTLELFARQGIAGTSLHAIAEHAQVTPALLHYYFGNKEQLIEVVLTECLIPIVNQFNDLLDVNSNEPLDTLLNVTQQMLQITASIPWLPALWVREVLNEDGYLREWVQEHAAKEQSERICRLTIAAQKKGQINKKLDPRLMVVSMTGLALFPLAGASMWKNLPGNENISMDVLSRHILELLTHGIAVKDVEVKK